MALALARCKFRLFCLMKSFLEICANPIQKRGQRIATQRGKRSEARHAFEQTSSGAGGWQSVRAAVRVVTTRWMMQRHAAGMAGSAGRTCHSSKDDSHQLLELLGLAIALPSIAPYS